MGNNKRINYYSPELRHIRLDQQLLDRQLNAEKALQSFLTSLAQKLETISVSTRDIHAIIQERLRVINMWATEAVYSEEEHPIYEYLKEELGGFLKKGCHYEISLQTKRDVVVASIKNLDMEGRPFRLIYAMSYNLRQNGQTITLNTEAFGCLFIKDKEKKDYTLETIWKPIE